MEGHHMKNATDSTTIEPDKKTDPTMTWKVISGVLAVLLVFGILAMTFGAAPANKERAGNLGGVPDSRASVPLDTGAKTPDGGQTGGEVGKKS